MMKSNGFTLVELVLVVVLIGLLSIIGMGIFAQQSDYTARMARDTLLNMALLAHQRALGTVGDDQTDQVTLTLKQSAGEWRFSLSQNVTSNTTSNIEYDTHTVTRGGALLSINGRELADGSTTTIAWTLSGRLAQQFAVRFDGSTHAELCLSQTGAVYATACQP